MPPQLDVDWKPLARGSGRARKRAASDAVETLEPQGRDYGGGAYSIGDMTAAAARGACWATGTGGGGGADSGRVDDADVHGSSLHNSSGQEDEWRDAGGAFGCGGGYGGRPSALPALPMEFAPGAARGGGGGTRWQQPDTGNDSPARRAAGLPTGTLAHVLLNAEC